MIAKGAAPDQAIRRRAVVNALAFAAGIITVFVLLGASASWLGGLLGAYFEVLRYGAAALITLMGLHFLGILRIGVFHMEVRSQAGDTQNLNLAGSYLIGLAFAFGWTPCVGPVLSAVLFTASSAEQARAGMALLFVYGLGMTLPFVLAAFNCENVVDVTMEPAISTNPFFEFEAIVPEAGEFKFTWYDDDGSVYETAKKIAIG